jgi:hypothetical protein
MTAFLSKPLEPVGQLGAFTALIGELGDKRRVLSSSIGSEQVTITLPDRSRQVMPKACQKQGD